MTASRHHRPAETTRRPVVPREKGCEAVYLVLSELEDNAALWLVARFRAAGLTCAHATPQALSFAARRTQRLGRSGADAVVEIAGLSVTQPTLVVNRMLAPPDAAWRAARASERDYATAELTAFVLSWLHGLRCPVRNRADPACLAGPSPHPLVAAVLAAQAGIPVPAMGFGSSADPPSPLFDALRGTPGGVPVHAVVCDGRLLGIQTLQRRAGEPIPVGLPDAVARFATAIRAARSLIGIDFVVRDGRWAFGGTTPLPDLACAGEEVVRELVSLAAEVAA